MRLINFIFIFLVLCCAVSALTPEEQAYFDNQHTKTVAQMSSKMDSVQRNIETNLEASVAQASEHIEQRVNQQIKSNLRSIVIGLAGMIIVVNAVFRIIEYKFMHSRNIMKYESELKQKRKELDNMIKEYQLERARLDKYRQEIMSYGKIVTYTEPPKQKVPFFLKYKWHLVILFSIIGVILFSIIVVNVISLLQTPVIESVGTTIYPNGTLVT